MRATPTSLAALRWHARAPQLLVLGTVGVLCLAGLRAAVRPSHDVVAASPSAAVDASDPAADAFAQSFARAYLSWDGSDPMPREHELAHLMSSTLDPDGGVQAPPGARQRVTWTAVEASDAVVDGRRVTVDVGTSDADWHLSVLVARDRRGRMSVSAYPAVVGPPTSTSALEPTPLTPVDDPAVEAVARRVIANYLAGARENLAADLAPGADVAVPRQRLRLRSVGDLGWITSQHTLRVEISVHAGRGVVLTLAYDLGLVRRAGRWLARTLVQTPPPKEAAP